MGPLCWRTVAAVCLPSLVFATSLAGSGCGGGSSLPQTYPVTGQVVFKGGAPLPGGLIQFTSSTESQLTVAGSIQPDGTFSLSTVVGAQKVSGAVPGKYRVRVLPPQRKDQPLARLQPPATLFQVEPTDNHFLIEVQRLPPAP